MSEHLPAARLVEYDAPLVAELQRLLQSYNQQAAKPYDFAPIYLIQCDSKGQLVGGALAASGWNWLQIDSLYVVERHRGLGIATRLVQQVESIAKTRGCIGAFLDTFDFQARGFYEKIGYQVFGTLADMPPGHTRYWMRKLL